MHDGAAQKTGQIGKREAASLVPVLSSSTARHLLAAHSTDAAYCHAHRPCPTAVHNAYLPHDHNPHPEVHHTSRWHHQLDAKWHPVHQLLHIWRGLLCLKQHIHQWTRRHQLPVQHQPERQPPSHRHRISVSMTDALGPKLSSICKLN